MAAAADSKHEVILVIGGTGKIGTQFVALAAGDAVRKPTIRVATRDPNSADSKLLTKFGAAGSVVPVQFDIDKPEVMAAALKGVNRLLIIPPFTPDMEGWHKKLLAAVAAACAALPRIVKISVTGARAPAEVDGPGFIPLSHWKGEEVVRGSKAPNCVIRPTIFAQHFGMSPIYTKGNDKLYLPTGAGSMAFVDCHDIALFAYALLSISDEHFAPHNNKAYELTGSQAYTAQEVADTISLVGDRKIELVEGVAAFSARCAELKVPDGLKGIYGECAKNSFKEVHHTEFTALTGRIPHPFAKFAEDNKYFFTK